MEDPPYGIRKGIIPLFIAYVIREYKETAILYFKGKEVELTASILSGINDKPEDYTLLLEEGTSDREEYLISLENMFSNYADASYTGTNRVFAIVKSMQTWMRSLPDYTKKFTRYYMNGAFVNIDNNAKVLRNDLLKFEINAREMLFEDWKEKLSPHNEYAECLSEIQRVKNFLDKHIIVFKKNLIHYLVELFMPGYSVQFQRH
mgnify:CR=1 FL=1